MSVTAMVVVPSARVRPLPNNLGPTLLIAIGVLTSPLVFGVPLVLVGLALVRTAQGRLAWPSLDWNWHALLCPRRDRPSRLRTCRIERGSRL